VGSLNALKDAITTTDVRHTMSAELNRRSRHTDRHTSH